MEHGLRLPGREGRPGDQGDLQDRHAEGHVGLRLQHAAADVRRPGGAEGAGASCSISNGSTTTSITTPMSAPPATSTTRSCRRSGGRRTNGRRRCSPLPRRGRPGRDGRHLQADRAATARAPTARSSARRCRSCRRRATSWTPATRWSTRPTGQPLAFEILVTTKEDEKLALAYQRTLDRIGIKATIRSVDAAQFQQRRQTFDFDMTRMTWPASLSPGNEQNFRWSQAVGRHRGLVQPSRGKAGRRSTP